jgi:hypothetical protein
MSLIPFAGAVQKFNRQRGGYQIERSLRFNSADSAYLNRTPASASNRKTWTWSGWVKKSVIAGDYPPLFNAGQSAPDTVLRFSDADVLNAILENGGGGNSRLDTTQVFRDSSAWYHIVWAVDTTLATANDRQRLYVNSVEVTAFSTRTNPSLNFDTQVNNTVEHRVGGQRYASYYNGYLTEINFIDGSALDPTSFGEYNEDTGVWQPKAYTGARGTNGFYLNFSNNSGVTSTTLGKDRAGSNNWTPNNFSVTAGAGNDSLVDTPNQYGTDTGAGGQVRGNYCTWNPLANLGLTLSNGNLTNAYTTALWTGTSATLAMDSGKWYFEYTVNATGAYTQIGVITVGKPLPTGGTQLQNGTTFAWGYQTFGMVFHAGSETSSGITSATTNDVISVAVDIDAGKIWIGKNGTFFNSGNPAAGTNAAYTNLSGAMIPVVFSYGTESGDTNFGQRPFAYTAPSGFKALCTQNLPEPTVVQGDDYFNTVLYTGDGSNPRGITGVGFQPDFVWLKNRSAGWGHRLSNAVVGANYALETNSTNAELFQNQYGYLTSFNSDGFTVTAGSTADYFTNSSGNNYVAWNWKANGAGVTNTDGSITSTVSANPDAGFSIVTYTGNGSAGATVGHGLGVAPSMIIVKNRSASTNWHTFHTSLGPTKYLALNLTSGEGTASSVWNNTAPTTSVFSIADDGNNNGSGQSIIAYCFAAIPGYSAFGSYTGNGSTDGPFVYTGFRPRFVMIKRTDSSDAWLMNDTSRSNYNGVNYWLQAESSDAESTNSPYQSIYLSNGFKLTGTSTSDNASGGTYIYMAFAENPFKYSLAR